MRILTAGDLRLEPLLAEHAEEMFAVLSDPAIYEYENAPPASADTLRQRYSRQQARRSPDGRELWLNWVVRTATGQLIGYVQATVFAGGHAFIAYEFASAHWGQGLASRAVTAMIEELQAAYQVRTLSAVLKTANQRSLRLLQRLDFGAPEHRDDIEADEWAVRRELVCT